MKNSYYSGIGSRNAPTEILKAMTKYAQILSQLEYTLRSGGAKGSDKAFELGANKKEIFKYSDAQEWAYDYVRYCLPIDRPDYESPSGYLNWDPYVKGLLARNMMQVLGRDGNSPVDFLVCWTPDKDYKTSLVGGTGYAIRCALRNNIPVYNLVYKEEKISFECKLREILRIRLSA